MSLKYLGMYYNLKNLYVMYTYEILKKKVLQSSALCIWSIVWLKLSDLEKPYSTSSEILFMSHVLICACEHNRNKLLFAEK